MYISTQECSGQQHSLTLWWGRLQGSLQGWSQESLGKCNLELVCPWGSSTAPWCCCGPINPQNSALSGSSGSAHCTRAGKVWRLFCRAVGKNGTHCFFSFDRRLTMGCGHFTFFPAESSGSLWQGTPEEMALCPGWCSTASAVLSLFWLPTRYNPKPFPAFPSPGVEWR